MDERMVGPVEWRTLTDLVVTFDGEMKRGLIRGPGSKTNVAREALRGLLEKSCVYPVD